MGRWRSARRTCSGEVTRQRQRQRQLLRAHFRRVPLPGVGGWDRRQSSSHALSCWVLCLLLALACKSAAASSTRSMPLQPGAERLKQASANKKQVQQGSSAAGWHLFSKADKLTVVIPPNCSRRVTRRTHRSRGGNVTPDSSTKTLKGAGAHLRYRVVQLLQELFEHRPALGSGDAVGFVDGKHNRFALVDSHLHQRQVLLPQHTLQCEHAVSSSQ